MVLLHPNESNREWYLFDRFEYLYKQLCVLFRYYFGAKIIQQALLWKFFIPFLFSKSSNTIVPKSIKFRDANGFRQITKKLHIVSKIFSALCQTPTVRFSSSFPSFANLPGFFGEILFLGFPGRKIQIHFPPPPPPPGVNSFHSLSLSFPSLRLHFSAASRWTSDINQPQPFGRIEFFSTSTFKPILD